MTLHDSAASSTADQPLPFPATRSTIFEKVPPAVRQQLDHAIISRDPPTYKAVFSRFDLAGRGVSFTSFYCYARKVRRHAALADAALAAGPVTTNSSAMTVNLLNIHLQQILMDDNPKSLQVKRFTDAWRGALRDHLAHEQHAARLQATEEAARSKVVRDVLQDCQRMAEAGYAEALERQQAQAATRSTGFQPVSPATTAAQPDIVVPGGTRFHPVVPAADADLTAHASRAHSRHPGSPPNVAEVPSAEKSPIPIPQSKKNPQSAIRTPQSPRPLTDQEKYELALEAARQRVARRQALEAAGVLTPRPDPYQDVDKEYHRLNAVARTRRDAAKAAQAAALATGLPPPFVDANGKPLDDLGIDLRVARESWLAECAAAESDL